MITGNEPSYPIKKHTTADAPGLTIRQQFAMAAMQGMLSNSYGYDSGVKPYSMMSYKELAENAVTAADALIAELNKPTE